MIAPLLPPLDDTALYANHGCYAGGRIYGSDAANRNSMFACLCRWPETDADPPHAKEPLAPMTHHRRIRPFNTKDTYPEQDLDNDLCQAVVAGGVVYLRGQIGQDLDTRESVGIGDVEAQAMKAMANIALLLEEAGGSLEDIVKVVVYLVDIRYREPVYRAMGRWLKGVYPVSTGIVVSALARPEWLVEIDATAVLPETP
jgi:enamine deaminase RidA (YjgF/YER057c/UK114 family)